MTSTAGAEHVRNYNRAYYYQRRSRPVNRIDRTVLELDKALECLMSEFAAGRSGPSGLRAQAIAHVRQAILILGPRTPLALAQLEQPAETEKKS